jgi:hypothetical protein
MTLAPATTADDLGRLGDEIATLSAHLDAATARLLALIREFDARGGWANGASTALPGTSALVEAAPVDRLLGRP